MDALSVWAKLVCGVCVVACCAACATSTSTTTSTLTTAPPPVDLAVGEPAIPLLGALVRAHNQPGASAKAVRAVVVEFARDAGVDVDVDAGAVVLGTGPLWLVSRQTDFPACADGDAGVVAGEPPRVVGCGARDLAAVAAFAVAAVRAPHAVSLVVVDDDDALARVLSGRGAAPTHRPRTIWTGGGRYASGVDADVLDVVVVDAGAASLAFAAASDDALVAAVGRVVSWRPPPREPAVVAERRALLGRAEPSELLRGWGDRLLGRPHVVDDAEVDRCTLSSLALRPSSPEEPSSWSTATVQCAAMPGREVGAVVDDVIAASGDRHVRVAVRAQREASATSMTLPAIVALSTALTSMSPRAAVLPQLDGAVRAEPSVCAHARRAGVPCFATLPLLLHPLDVSRRGKRDESVPVASVRAAAAVVAATVVAEGVVP